MWCYIKSWFYSEESVSIDSIEITPRNKQIITKLNPSIKIVPDTITVPVYKSKLEYYTTYDRYSSPVINARIVNYTEYQKKDKYDTVIDYNPDYETITVYNITIKSDKVEYILITHAKTVTEAQQIVNTLDSKLLIQCYVFGTHYTTFKNGAYAYVGIKKRNTYYELVKFFVYNGIALPTIALSGITVIVIAAVYLFYSVKCILS